MKKVKLTANISDFAEIRSNGYYYVDKTDLIKEILNNAWAKARLITRPNYFGKTTNMSMIAEFFDARKDNRKLFEGLSISGDKELCDEWMNQYPVISISFKEINGNNFETIYKQISELIALLYKSYEFIVCESDFNDYDKQAFSDLSEGKADIVDLSRSLELLTRLLHAHYKKRVILLMDAYDVPIETSVKFGYERKMTDVMKGLLYTVKNNSHLEFAVITGCLKTASDSIFTDVNNIVLDSVVNPRFDKYFGFSESEVDQLLEDFGLADKKCIFHEWYGGYHIGKYDLYCPYEVICYAEDLKCHSDKSPESYRQEDKGSIIIRSLIDNEGFAISKKLETLIAGGYIVQLIDEHRCCKKNTVNQNDYWSLLYLKGYLTVAKDVPADDFHTALMIPDEGIREIYRSTVIEWFNDTVQKWDRNKLFEAVWNGNTEVITEEMSRLLRQTISYYDYREDYYHAFLAGIFAGAGYTTESNKEHGEGRSDVVVKYRRDGKVAVFELKLAEKFDQLEKKCNEALQQIDERKYAEEF